MDVLIDWEGKRELIANSSTCQLKTTERW